MYFFSGGGGGHMDSAKIMIYEQGVWNYTMQIIRLANTETLARLKFICRINDIFNQRIFF